MAIHYGLDIPVAPFRFMDTVDCDWIWMDDDLHVWMNDDQAQFLNCPVANTALGLAYAVSDAFTDGGHGTGSHYHVANGHPYPGPPEFDVDNYAEVGGYFDDENIRGIVDFDITGMATTADARVNFDVTDIGPGGLNITPWDVGGLYGQSQWNGSLELFGFISDGVEALAKYSIASVSLGTLSVAGAIAGQTFSRDITAWYNARVAAVDNLVGIRLQATPEDPDNGAITLENFRIVIV